MSVCLSECFISETTERI